MKVSRQVSGKNLISNRGMVRNQITRTLSFLFLAVMCTYGYAGPKSTVCPNGVFDNGKIYDSANTLTSNTCASSGTSCANVYFYGRAAFESAVCSNGQWVLAGATPKDPDQTKGTGGDPIPVEPDGGIGDGAGPIPKDPEDSKTVVACPNGVFDNGQIYNSGNVLTNNTCATADAFCTNVYFYGRAAFKDAVCSNGQWLEAGPIPKDPDDVKGTGGEPIPVEPDGGIGDGAGPIPIEPDDAKPVAGCPNGIFDDGQMYDASNNYIANSCASEGQQCDSVYFYGVGKYDAAVCEDGKWTNPAAKLICGGIAGFQCPDDYTCVDDPTDSCDPKNSGADCIGVCQPAPAKPQCNFDNPDRQYAGESLEICSRILFVCDEGYQAFSDECGCGCEKIDTEVDNDTDKGKVDSGIACGPNVCGSDMVCCNSSCGICTAPDGFCIQLACAPGDF